MKKTGIYLMLLLVSLALWSCNEDEPGSESIFKDSTAPQTDFDRWLLSNYTYPYNIMFKYKMQDIESNKDFELAPATADKSVAMAKLLKYIWLETYEEVRGIDFVRTYSPKVIHLIGSGGYNSNNSVILGTAEGGMKITLYDVNDLNPENVDLVRFQSYMKTIFHEFSHILHQNKNYPLDFGELTKNDYVQADWSESTETLALAYTKGFVSRYARKEPNEDFVEMISIYVVYGQQNWDAILREAAKDENGALVTVGESGADIINRKLEIVKQYLRDSWSIDLNELRRVFEIRLASIDQLDLTHL
ncbi:MAG: putative zinc-binding metallopeptidase [Dysgonamonadaceae bacterium]|jgi:substrate import-associated zinc metallohydrolase lipoprotein|nr:putative zinc-binding metallopeptidase [Dysgonamonadaceae bacterium]